MEQIRPRTEGCCSVTYYIDDINITILYECLNYSRGSCSVDACVRNAKSKTYRIVLGIRDRIENI